MADNEQSRPELSFENPQTLQRFSFAVAQYYGFDRESNPTSSGPNVLSLSDPRGTIHITTNEGFNNFAPLYIPSQLPRTSRLWQQYVLSNEQAVQCLEVFSNNSTKDNDWGIDFKAGVQRLESELGYKKVGIKTNNLGNTRVYIFENNQRQRIAIRSSQFRDHVKEALAAKYLALLNEMPDYCQPYAANGSAQIFPALEGPVSFENNPVYGSATYMFGFRPAERREKIGAGIVDIVEGIQETVQSLSDMLRELK